jgi:8-amino-7-oxononanoate synthase
MSKPEHIDSADDGRPRNGSPRRRASDVLVPRPLADKPLRRQGDGWLERWMATVEDLARLKSSHPMLDAVIDEQVGRRIRIGDHWLADFASCNYLGLDLDQEVIDAVPEYLARWGTHPSWSRLLGSPVLYEQLEETTTALLGSEDSLLLPTITHIHMSVIPVLVGSGVMFLDERAHKTIYDGASVARGHGATIQRFRHNDAEHLEQVVKASRTTPRVIAVDGVNSMTGNAPDVKEFARIAREHDALLYVDDAHGFGVIGERSPDELCEWGVHGNGVVRHQGETYDNVVLVAGFSKAYSSLLSFLALPTRLKDVLKVAAPPYLYSGPSPIASLATAIAGLAVNDTRGDLYRAEIYRKTRKVVERLHALDIYTPNESGFPLIEIPLAHRDDIDVVGRYLFDRGVYVTMAAYPLVPKEETGFRIQITAANPDDQIDLLCEVLGEISERFELQHEHHRHLMLRAREARA